MMGVRKYDYLDFLRLFDSRSLLCIFLLHLEDWEEGCPQKLKMTLMNNTNRLNGYHHTMSFQSCTLTLRLIQPVYDSSLLNIPVENLPNRLSTLLGYPLLIILIINISHTEPRLIALGPLKITIQIISTVPTTQIRQNDSLQQAPPHISADVHPVERIRIGHSINIIAEILRAELIIEQLIKWEIVLPLQAGSVLSDVDLWTTVAVTQPLQQFAKPYRLSLIHI